MAPRLSPLLVKLLFELLYFVVNFSFSAHNFLILCLFSHEVSSALFNFISDLLGVLEVHFLYFSICCFNIIAEFIRDGFFPDECRSDIYQLFEQITIAGTQGNPITTRLSSFFICAVSLILLCWRNDCFLADFINFSIDQIHDLVISLFGLSFVFTDTELALQIFAVDVLIKGLLVFEFASLLSQLLLYFFLLAD